MNSNTVHLSEGELVEVALRVLAGEEAENSHVESCPICRDKLDELGDDLLRLQGLDGLSSGRALPELPARKKSRIVVNLAVLLLGMMLGTMSGWHFGGQDCAHVIPQLRDTTTEDLASLLPVTAPVVDLAVRAMSWSSE